MRKLVIKLIKICQSTPTHLHNACRFTPTCSNYALEAFENFNFFKASFLSIRRILRCRPFGKYGFDPVPMKENKNEKSN